MNEKNEVRMVKRLNEILSCKNLHQALEIGREVFGNPLVVSSVSYAVLAMTDEPTLRDAQWLAMKETQSIPISNLTNGNISRSYQRSRDTGTPTMDMSNGETPVLRKTLLSGDQLVGYLDAPLFYRMPSDMQVEFFDLLGNLIAVKMKQGMDRSIVPDNILDYFAYDLLEGKVEDRELIESRFRYFKWNPLHKGKVQIISIHCIRPDADNSAACRKLHEVLSTNVPACRSFLYGEEIKMICPVSDNLQKEGDLIEVLETLLSKGGFSAGVSRPTQLATQFAYANQQAMQAETLGRIMEPQRHLHQFDNLTIYFVLQRLESREEEELIHSAVQTLQEHDREHDGNLLQSLETYLNHNQSIGESAAALYIHRNTMNYRISKIHELTQLDLGDPTVVTHLQFSFYVLRHRIQRSKLPEIKKLTL